MISKWYNLELEQIWDLVHFAQSNYPDWDKLNKEYIYKLFLNYLNYTFVYYENKEIRGFATYQDWPDALNFILICLPYDRLKNLGIMEKGLKQAKKEGTLPDKPVVWWDDKKMKARGI